tara:strand:- start:278 stop:442 length:165 start_codon:yes stop_codon:yes gene_type:complete
VNNVKEKRRELVLNKGIEVMLPKGRRVPKPSWFDRTFPLLNWLVRVRIDIERGA